MERIKGLGLNGYKRRKESRSECLVQSGHAEIEGDNKLFIYGNALEVLNNLDCPFLSGPFLPPLV